VVQHLSEEWVALHEGPGASLPERKGASARLQHVVTGAPSGEVAYTLEIVDGRIIGTRVGRDDDAADCTFLITYKDAVPIAKGELDLHVGFMQGRVKMSGAGGPLLDVLPCTQSDEYRALVAQVAAATDFSPVAS
jgi:hypothetical protein